MGNRVRWYIKDVEVSGEICFIDIVQVIDLGRLENLKELNIVWSIVIDDFLYHDVTVVDLLFKIEVRENETDFKRNVEDFREEDFHLKDRVLVN